MIKFKVFDTLVELNTFEKSNRVLVINLETITTSHTDRIKLWYREINIKSIKEAKNGVIPKS